MANCNNKKLLMIPRNAQNTNVIRPRINWNTISNYSSVICHIRYPQFICSYLLQRSRELPRHPPGVAEWPPVISGDDLMTDDGRPNAVCRPTLQRRASVSVWPRDSSQVRQTTLLTGIVLIHVWRTGDPISLHKMHCLAQRLKPAVYRDLVYYFMPFWLEHSERRWTRTGSRRSIYVNIHEVPRANDTKGRLQSALRKLAKHWRHDQYVR